MNYLMRARHSTRAEMVHFGRVEAHISEDLKRFTVHVPYRTPFENLYCTALRHSRQFNTSGF